MDRPAVTGTLYGPDGKPASMFSVTYENPGKRTNYQPLYSAVLVSLTGNIIVSTEQPSADFGEVMKWIYEHREY